jgi:hypothetical protein
MSHEARKQALDESLRTLAAWAAKRAELNVNADTTLSMLRRKVEEINNRVTRAGRKTYD